MVFGLVMRLRRDAVGNGSRFDLHFVNRQAELLAAVVAVMVGVSFLTRAACAARR